MGGMHQRGEGEGGEGGEEGEGGEGREYVLTPFSFPLYIDERLL